MISKFEELNKLFEEIDSVIFEKINIFIIGGAMLLYYGIKDVTKDVDIIVGTEKEFLAMQNALKNLRFASKIPTFEYEKVNLSQIFIREDFRIDLFNKTVCKGFHLSDAMKNRAQKIKELNYLTIFICSSEDVFLFKTFTEREADITDCLSIAQKKKIDWIIILNELKNQIKISGNKVWITWVGERLDILKEQGLEIPIMNKVNNLRTEYFDMLYNNEQNYHKIYK